MSESYLEIQLDQQPIELCKLLKIASLVAGGGEAKVAISEGYVLLNGEVEYQKRKKVFHNDIVEFNGETLQIIVNEDLENEINEEKITQPTQTQNTASFAPKQEPKQDAKQGKKVNPEKKSAAIFNDESTTKKRTRKPISF
jgi:ribosome-associated protein